MERGAGTVRVIAHLWISTMFVVIGGDQRGFRRLRPEAKLAERFRGDAG